MMTNKDFLLTVEKKLNECISTRFAFGPKIMEEAAKYAVFGGGKRIRPTLCFLSAAFCGVSADDAVDFATIIELIHSYSLVHDDLPCMDNDEMRRGKPTVHKKYGETLALLCGDALLNVAYEFLLDSCMKDTERLRGGQLIAAYAGMNGMIGGQSMEFCQKKFSQNDYMEIAHKKTAALITASVAAPATLSSDVRKQKDLMDFGKFLGLCYQISDDLLDKGSDEKNSIVTVAGEEKARELLASMRRKAVNTLIPYGEKATDLLDYCEKICSRTH